MRDFLKVYVPIAILIVAGFALAYHYVNPAPPSHLRMAAGAQGGAYDQLARQYQAYLARNGVSLEILSTAGSLQNLTLLSSPTSGVDLAFVQGGTGDRKAMPGLRAIASLYYEPIWIFVRGAPPDRLSALRGRRIATGADGSGTRAAAEMLLAANGITADSASFVALAGKDAAAALKAGRIDAAFLVTSRQDPVVNDLALTPGIGLVSLAQAEAYARLFPFLSVVTLPKGLVSLDKNIPAQDVSLLAPAAALVARSSLHPALIDLLVAAAQEINGQGDDFGASGEFPSARHVDFPVSADARRALASGPPFLRRYLPFWAAVLVDRMWILVLPLLTLMIPLLRAAPPTYRWQVRRRIQRHYAELRRIEAQARDYRRPEALARAHEELDRLQASAGRIQLPLGFAEDLYHLRLHIDFVRRSLPVADAAAPPQRDVLSARR